MWVRAETSTWPEFAAEVFEFFRGETAFEKGAGIDAGCGVALKVNRVALELLTASAEKMVEADFIERRGGSVGRNVATDVVLHAVGAHDHGDGVPTNEALDAALKFLIARKWRFEPGRNRIDVRRVRRKWQIQAGDLCVGSEAFQNFNGNFWAAGFEHRIEGFEPLGDLVFVHVVGHYVCVLFHNSRRVPFVFLVARRQGAHNLCWL